MRTVMRTPRIARGRWLAMLGVGAALADCGYVDFTLGGAGAGGASSGSTASSSGMGGSASSSASSGGGGTCPLPEPVSPSTDAGPDPVGDGGILWYRQLSGGGKKEHVAAAVAVDTTGEVALAGVTDGDLDLGDGAKLSISTAGGGRADLVVARYTAAGRLRWARDLPRDYDDLYVPAALAFSPAGDLVVAGSSNPIPGVPCASPRVGAFFLVLGSAAGELLWEQPLGGGKVHRVAALGTAPAPALPDVFVTGTLVDGEALDLGVACAKLAAGPGKRRAFAARFSGTTRQCVWAHQLGDDAGMGRGIAVLASGAAFVTGQFQGHLTQLSCSPPPAIDTQVFVMKLAPDGACEWARAFAGGAMEGGDLALVGGDPVVTGSFVGSDGFDGGASPVSHDTFVARLASADGGVLWHRTLGFGDTDLTDASGSPKGLALAVSAAQEILVAGSQLSGNCKPGDPIVNCREMFLARLDGGSGAVGATTVWGDDASVSAHYQQVGRGVAAGGDGVYVAGDFTGTLALGAPGPTLQAGSYDIVLLKLAP
jgi:hypothetical protein